MSFFGTASLPRGGGAGGGGRATNSRNAENGNIRNNKGYGNVDSAQFDEGEGSRLDELLETKFKYSDAGIGIDPDDADVDVDNADTFGGSSSLLDDEDDDLNEETFGGGVGISTVGNDQQSLRALSDNERSRNLSFVDNQSSTASGPRMLSLDEIEAQMIASRNQSNHLSMQHQAPHIPQQNPPGFPGYLLQSQQISSQFGNLSLNSSSTNEKRIMSVTEIEQAMLLQKRQQQNSPFLPQNSSSQNFQQNQFFPQQQQQMHMIGRPHLPPNIQQLHHQMIGAQPGSPSNVHPHQRFNGIGQSPQLHTMIPPGNQIIGPSSGSVLLQNQVFNNQGFPSQFHQQHPQLPQFGNFSPSPSFAPPNAESPNSSGGPARESPTFNQIGSQSNPLSNLQTDELLRNAQQIAHQQHQIQMQQQQNPPQNVSGVQQHHRGTGRGEYGQMRYNNIQAQTNKKNVLMHTGFSNDANAQRGASGKGPGPFDGGWSVQSNRTPRWIRYSNSMTQYEKETIARIQIGQLVSDNPYRDDFYYQILTQYRSGNNESASISGSNWQQSMLNQDKDSSLEMHAQMKKLIEGKRMKPKGTTLALEGALGKISLTSVRNPRQLIQINQAAKQSHTIPTFSRLTRRKILKSVEKVYTCVLNLEQLKRTIPNPGSEEEEEWHNELDQNVAEMWEELGLAENVPFTLPHPFPYFLSYSKGKRILPRLVGYLTPDQIFTALTTLFSRAESLDVCNMPAGSEGEAIDLFVSTVLPPTVSFISEVPLQVVNAFLRTLLERHNMVWLAKSKAGLAFLALLLSRAEILKQGGGAQQGLRPPAADDLTLWSELYNFLFASLQGNFAAIFPPAPEADTSGKIKIHDEVYIWQFLAAMAVGATTVDHQRVLLTEVRDKIFETSRRGSSSDNPEDARALANVNLFLNALGLGIDAHQLATS
ncbi:hypothetical protein HK100_010860, partial [Physocladia obscura]